MRNQKSQYQKPAAVIPFDICKSITDILLVEVQKKTQVIPTFLHIHRNGNPDKV